MPPRRLGSVTLTLVAQHAEQTVLECPECAGPREFVRPVCGDGHGVCCPERCCIECGAAVVLIGCEITAGRSSSARRELRGAA